MEVISLSDRDAEESPAGFHATQLAAGEEMSVQHSRIEPGSGVPRHSHPHEQLGFVCGTEGAELTFIIGGGEEEFVVAPGDSYVIPGGETHETENRSDAIIENVNVFSPPRAEPDF